VTLNAGDAAILYAMIDLLRAAFGKDAEFIVYDTHGEAVSRYYPELTFRKLLYFNLGSHKIKLLGRRLRAAQVFSVLDKARFYLGLWCLRRNIRLIPGVILSKVELRDVAEYNSADIIVSSGGTYLVENYSLAHRIFDYKISQYLGRPLIFFTQSLGPFSNPSIRKSLKRIFDRSILILVRDKQSLNNLTDMGVSNRSIHITADAAFALTDPVAVETAKNATRRPGSPLKVAISAREWRHFKTVAPADGMRQYLQSLCALSAHLIERHGAEITFLSTCQGMPEYWTDDSKVARKIVEGLPYHLRSSVSVDAGFHHPKDLAEMLKSYDLVVATRMHMAILALGAGTPVLPIAYEFKMRELFERLGQGNWVQDIEKISPESLIRAADSFLDSISQSRAALFAAVEKERQDALESVSFVKKAFDEWQLRSNGRQV
jgi:colanic acid/amylovoran biosynthesis protein